MFATPLLLLAVAQGAGQDSLWDRLSFSADGRLRAESTFDQLNGEDRHRGRMRFRVSGKYVVMDGLTAHARLTTRSDGNDANNVHWDFGDGSDGLAAADVGLDRFFLEWQSCENVTLRGGKMPHVYSRPPVYGEFVWDGDVQPAGVSAVWDLGTHGDTQFDVRAAGYVLQENGAANDPSVIGVQANAKTTVGDNTTLWGATSFSVFGSLDDGTFGNQGNSATGGILDEDFTVWDTWLAAQHEGGPLDRQVGFLQFVNNLDDDSGEDTGFAAGIEFGQRNPGDYSYFLAFCDFDANAVFSPAAQDDTPISGTGTGMGMTGILAGVRRIVSERVAIRAWVLQSDADDVEDPFRARVDVDFKIN